MRILLLLLLIALFPLRGFAGEQMQTRMGVMGLHQAAMLAATQTSAGAALPAQSEDATDAAPNGCCSQCNSCELCHLLLAQVAVPTLPAQQARPPMLQTAVMRFASADVRRAHKPPLFA
jgi:hypothetical protein